MIKFDQIPLPLLPRYKSCAQFFLNPRAEPTDYRFDWDPAKAATNLKKHGVSFTQAALVFADPLSSTQPDPHYETRWKTFGLVGSKLIVVVHEDAEHEVHGKARITIRIISAPNATPPEIRSYRNDPL